MVAVVGAERAAFSRYGETEGGADIFLTRVPVDRMIDKMGPSIAVLRSVLAV